MKIPKMANIAYKQMPAPRQLLQRILACRAKARMQKTQGGGKLLVQISGGARGMVMDEIDTCIIQIFSLSLLLLASVSPTVQFWRIKLYVYVYSIILTATSQMYKSWSLHDSNSTRA